MSVLTSGRSEPCKDSQGGIDELWLSAFVQYGPAAIVGYRSMLITSFPPTLMYQYEGAGIEFSETFSDGWDQQISISMAQQTYIDSVNLMDVVNLRVRAIVVDNLGKFRVAGLHNGLDAEVRAESGKEVEGFSGYTLTLTGTEPYQAPFISAFPGGGSPPLTGFAKAPGYTTECYLSSSSIPSSTSQSPASCNILV